MPKEKNKMVVGMRSLKWFPIVSEPANGHPTYGAPILLGAAVKGVLSVNATPYAIVGDDINQIEGELFAGGQFDTETTLNDLEVNAALYGHDWAETTGEMSKGTDHAPSGGLAFVEPYMRTDRTIVYRATCLFKATALNSSEKHESDTRTPGQLTQKNYPVSFKISEDNLRCWRARNEFATEDEANAYVTQTFGAAT